ncbi:hypothetical protein C2G38_2226360 [Gigaspora rosea]|uniref:Uncharacterized protein n=1 Tax=Gigaspora rosea TaxID=44941 RepID=A0A397TZY6_9GLOM|nr:hypothetical protein C2G38_2226360 [Gigaspora rosea]
MGTVECDHWDLTNRWNPKIGSSFDSVEFYLNVTTFLATECFYKINKMGFFSNSKYTTHSERSSFIYQSIYVYIFNAVADLKIIDFYQYVYIFNAVVDLKTIDFYQYVYIFNVVADLKTIDF